MLDLKKIYAPILTGKESWSGAEIMVFCPFHSHNHKTPSMSINTKTGQFKCFSCGAEGGAVSAWAKMHNISISEALKDLDEFDDDFKERPVQIMPQLPKQPKAEPEHDYSDYLLQILNESLLHEDRFAFYGKKLYELRGITYPTAVACCVGYVYDKDNKGWIFPTWRYPDNKCIGYEIRKKDFTKFSNGCKVYRSKGGCNCLSITYSGNSGKCYICEGYIDACFLFQYLHEQRQKKYPNDILKQKVQDTILTPSNGVKILPNVVAELELWNDFDEIIFITDNDKWLPDKKGVLRSPGNEAKAQLAAMEHGGKFKFYSGLLEGEDFELWFKRKQKEGSL